jgi:hypothetical protein
MELVRYETPEECYASMYGLPYEELKGSELNGWLVDGEEMTVPIETAIDGIRQLGIWGWISKEECIHYWYDPEKASDQVLMHFLGHELAHSTEPDDIEEIESEMRAEEYGHNASNAYELMMEIKGKLI